VIGMKPVSERYRVQELLFRVALLREEVNVWAREKEKGGKVRRARENAHSQCMGGEMMSQLEVKRTEQRSQRPYVGNGHVHF